MCVNMMPHRSQEWTNSPHGQTLKCSEKLQTENLFSLIRTTVEARLRFAKLHLKKPQDFWNNVLYAEETKLKMFGYIFRNTANNQKYLKSTKALTKLGYATGQ